MARRTRTPFSAALAAFGRSSQRLQRAAKQNPWAKAAERATRKAVKQTLDQARRQNLRSWQVAGEVGEQTARGLREAAAVPTRRVAKAARVAMTGLVTPVAAPPPVAGGQWTVGRWGSGPLATRRYRLFVPDAAPGVAALPTPRPLLVLLHGCGQDSACFSVATRVGPFARDQQVVVLMPEQSTQANAQRCWNWFRGDTVAAHEATLIWQIVERVIQDHGIDRQRVYVAGLSAGAAMTLTLALRYPDRIAAVASHSGPVPHSARRPDEATRSMHGHPRVDGEALRDALQGRRPPPALIVQGDRDRVVDPGNAGHIAALWLSLHPGATASGLAPPRPAEVRQRGLRHRAIVTDWPDPIARPGASRVPYVRLMRIEGLAHAWSGGPASQAFCDPQGPDALKLAWQFFRPARAVAPG